MFSLLRSQPSSTLVQMSRTFLSCLQTIGSSMGEDVRQPMLGGAREQLVQVPLASRKVLVGFLTLSRPTSF